MKRKNFVRTIIAAIFIGALVIYWFTFAKERQELERRRHQISDIEMACFIFAKNHAGQFPRHLRDLTEIYGDAQPFFSRALAELELDAPGAHTTDNVDAVLIRERAADAKGRCYFGYIDGHCQLVSLKPETGH